MNKVHRKKDTAIKQSRSDAEYYTKKNLEYQKTNLKYKLISLKKETKFNSLYDNYIRDISQYFPTYDSFITPKINAFDESYVEAIEIEMHNINEDLIFIKENDLYNQKIFE